MCLLRVIEEGCGGRGFQGTKSGKRIGRPRSPVDVGRPFGLFQKYPWLAAEPMTTSVTRAFLAGTESIRVPTGSAGATAGYRAFPDRGGWRGAPDFRPGHRRELVERLLRALEGLPAG